VIDALRRHASKKHSVLDVGSGQGRFLSALRTIGFKGSLVGVDPFLEGDSLLSNGVELRRREIGSVDGRYDVITCIHTFEHVPDPERFFSEIPGLLSAGGTCIVSIPVADGAAWKRYQCDWVQMDPPRHMFLHTSASVGHLARGAGLRLKEIIWDSTSFQFWGSALVRRRIPVAPFWKSYIRSSWRIVPDAMRARSANRAGVGDQATFVLVMDPPRIADPSLVT
jgi:cyclopropane fatty-acyl-phospholipid synthase-like methyltransferase